MVSGEVALLTGAVAAAAVTSLIAWRELRQHRALNQAKEDLRRCAYAFAGLLKGAIKYDMLDPSMIRAANEILIEFDHARRRREEILGMKEWIIS